MEFDPENPFGQEHKLKHNVQQFFEIESEFMATDAENYSQNDIATGLRNRAIVILEEYSGTDDDNYDPFVPFLAMNYFDRCCPFRRETPDTDLGLFCIGCLVLAWKMRTNAFSLRQFLEDHNLSTKVISIKRMECWILSNLNWRTRSITSLCFLDFFISLFNLFQASSRQILKCCTIQPYLLYLHYDIKFTQFKPSIVAASSLLAVTEKNEQYNQFYEAISTCQFVEKVALDKCICEISIKRTMNIAEDILPHAADSPDRANADEAATLK